MNYRMQWTIPTLSNDKAKQKKINISMQITNNINNKNEFNTNSVSW